jgi:hypothetical protein
MSLDFDWKRTEVVLVVVSYGDAARMELIAMDEASLEFD